MDARRVAIERAALGPDALNAAAAGQLDAAAARFAGDCARAGLSKEQRLGLAVSGGPDSMAMLILAHCAMPHRIAVASVDHGLRPEATAETEMVARLCASLAMPHRTLRVVPATAGNLQANARAARYDALAAWANEAGVEALATAHHADDQAETLLMRLARGAGAKGLSAMRSRAVVPGTVALPLLRPLLGWRRSELAALLALVGVAPAFDPSNRDHRFLRVRIRDWLSSAPAGVDASRIAASAAHLADDDAALDWAAEREWEQCVTFHAAYCTYRPAAPFAIRLRVLSRIMRQLAREGMPRGEEVARLARRLESGESATLAGLLCKPDDGCWLISPAPPRKSR